MPYFITVVNLVEEKEYVWIGKSQKLIGNTAEKAITVFLNVLFHLIFFLDSHTLDRVYQIKI